MRSRWIVVLAAIVVMTGMVPASGQSSSGTAALTATTDTLSIVKDGQDPTNVEIAIALLEGTPLTPERVLMGRDDLFVDSMAGGVLQGDSPLLLIPPAGPIPDEVMSALDGTGAGRVTLLGGTAAITPTVEQELVDAGYTVDRRAGDSRFETATAIATDVPDADTAIVVRAFAAPDAIDPTQAFADSLGAGFLSAENGWPILLTQTDVLSGPTRDYLAGSAVKRVLILGGTAAVSDAVAGQLRDLVPSVQRIAGPDRFSTGIEIIKEDGAQSAADVARVTLVESQSPKAWAGGFAAAAHAAFYDAPIVYTSGGTIPPASREWLEGAATFAQAGGDVVLTCVTPFAACAEAREVIGLSPLFDVELDPDSGSAVARGQRIDVSTGGATTAEVSGDCIDTTGPLAPDGTVRIADSAPETCTLVLSLPLPDGATQTETATYLTRTAGLTAVSIGPDGVPVGGSFPDVSAEGTHVVFVSDGDPTGEGLSATHTYHRTEGVTRAIDGRPDGSLSAGLAGVVTQTDRPRITSDGRFAVFTSSDAGLDTEGLSGGEGRNVYVRDLTTGGVRLVSLDAEGTPVSQPRMADISDDGQLVVYQGSGVGVPGGNRSNHVFLHNPATGVIDVVRDYEAQPVFDLRPEAMDLAAGGSMLVFTSTRPELIASDTNARPDVFAYDVGQRTIQRLTVGPDAEQSTGEASGSAAQVAVDAAGQHVAFISAADNLVDGGSRGPDAFVRNLTTNQTLLISRGPDGGDNNDAGAVDISADGTVLVFTSSRPVIGESSGDCGVYRTDAVAAEATRLNPVGVPGTCLSTTTVADTGTVVFDTFESYDTSDGNDDSDVYQAGS